MHCISLLSPLCLIVLESGNSFSRVSAIALINWISFVEMKMLRCMNGDTRKDRIKNEKIRESRGSSKLKIKQCSKSPPRR